MAMSGNGATTCIAPTITQIVQDMTLKVLYLVCAAFSVVVVGVMSLQTAVQPTATKSIPALALMTSASASAAPQDHVDITGTLFVLFHFSASFRQSGIRHPPP